VHVGGGAVTGEYDLLVVKMQVVEYVEESVLGFLLPHEILNVIYYEAVDTLIELYEFVVFAVTCCHSVLALEKSGCDI
jgi:hypothetical protein